MKDGWYTLRFSPFEVIHAYIEHGVAQDVSAQDYEYSYLAGVPFSKIRIMSPAAGIDFKQANYVQPHRAQHMVKLQDYKKKNDGNIPDNINAKYWYPF